MRHENDRWMADLRGGAERREPAIAELRVTLLRNLRKALADDARADEALLEDCVQDALVRILDQLDQFAGRSRFVTWATSIAVHGVMSELRRKRWKDVSLDQVLDEGNNSPTGSQQASSAELGLQRQALLEAMQTVIAQQLSERQRRALLAELRGMPQEEIARELGSTRNAVYKLTHDARKKLKQGLEAVGYTAADVLAATSH